MSNELTVFQREGQLLTDSREVAVMIDRQHKDLLRDIRGYIEIMEKSGERKIAPSDFFIESTYLNSQNKEQPCYLLTKKGCDMVANKLTGQKGVLFTAVYVTAFEKMQEHIAKGTPLPLEIRESIAEAKLLNARARVSAQWMKLSERVDSPEYRQICAHYASGVLAGKPVLPLPEAGERHLSAGEVGQMFGVTAQKIGAIANANGLKTDEFGKWYHDKSPYSPKQVDTFKYNHKAVEQFKRILDRKELQ